jgi:hypothetical protein
MYAFERDEYKSVRHVIIEKVDGHKYWSPIERYDFENYDTVELISGNKRVVGLLNSYNLRVRGGKKGVVIGFCNVSIITGTTIQSILASNFNLHYDDVKNNNPTFIRPCRAVLFEKNIIGIAEEVNNIKKRL